MAGDHSRRVIANISTLPAYAATSIGRKNCIGLRRCLKGSIIDGEHFADQYLPVVSHFYRLQRQDIKLLTLRKCCYNGDQKKQLEPKPATYLGKKRLVIRKLAVIALLLVLFLYILTVF